MGGGQDKRAKGKYGGGQRDPGEHMIMRGRRVPLGVQTSVQSGNPSAFTVLDLPDLSVGPWHDGLPSITAPLEGAAEAIAVEFDQLRRAGEPMPPSHLPASLKDQEQCFSRPILDLDGLCCLLTPMWWNCGYYTGNWPPERIRDDVERGMLHAFCLMEEGVWNKALCSLCPQTMAVLCSLPICESSLGCAYWGVQSSGTAMSLHCGVSNAKLRVQLLLPGGLGDCTVTCGGQARRSHAGQAVVFDTLHGDPVGHRRPAGRHLEPLPLARLPRAPAPGLRPHEHQSRLLHTGVAPSRLRVTAMSPR